MGSAQVFVRLLDEGTTVYRPVSATPLADGVYRLDGTPAPDEAWEFAPGTTVRCKSHQFADGTKGLLVVGGAS